MKFILPSLLSILLAACSSSSSVLPPVELTPIEKPLVVHTRWKNTVGAGVGENYLKLKPVFSNGVGYVADYTGYVRAFDGKTGSTRWEIQMEVPLAGGPSLELGMLLFGTSQGEVYALNPENGELRWHSEVSSEVLAPPRGADGTIIVRTVDGQIHALDSSDGKRKWVYGRSIPLLTLRGESAPVITNGIVLVGSDNGKLTALTLQDGTVLWETRIAVPHGRSELERMVDIDADPVVVENTVYVVTYQGRLAAVQLDSGRILWVRDISSYAGLVVDAYRVYLTDAESRIWALNRYNGSTLWRQDKLLRRSITRPVLQGPHLVVADYNGYVHWLKREDGSIVARKFLNEDWYLFNEVDPESDTKMFPKANNVLVEPVTEQDLVMVYDRSGNIAAYQLESP